MHRGIACSSELLDELNASDDKPDDVIRTDDSNESDTDADPDDDIIHSDTSYAATEADFDAEQDARAVVKSSVDWKDSWSAEPGRRFVRQFAVRRILSDPLLGWTRLQTAAFIIDYIRNWRERTYVESHGSDTLWSFDGVLVGAHEL